MSIQARNNRYNLILEKKIDDFETDIQYHLKKLNQSCKILTKFKDQQQSDSGAREYANAQLVISKLQSDLSELETINIPLKDVKLETKHYERIDLIKNDVLNHIKQFNQIHSKNSTKFVDDSVIDRTEYSDNKSQLQVQLDAAELNESKEKLKQIQSLEQDIVDLNCMVSDFSNLVHEQQFTIDDINQNLTETQENIKSGTESLIKASASSVVPLTCALISGAVFGPVGAIITFKLSTGIATAFGASALTYTCSKYFQKKKKIECKEELEAISEKS